MPNWQIMKGRYGPVTFTLLAVVLGLMPVGFLIGCFELFVPSTRLADRLAPPTPSSLVDLVRYSLFITVGGIHLLLCAAVSFLSLRNLSSRLSLFEFRKVLFLGIGLPFVFIVIVYIAFCSYESKLYRLSFARVINVIRSNHDFDYQFDACSQHSWLWTFCSAGNFHLSLYSFLLVIFGLQATLSACADVGVSHFHHSRRLTPKRLAVAGNEMQDDMNRHAASLLLTLASSSVAISIFQQLGANLFDLKSPEAALYLAAGQTASLFWPIAFSSVFIGIFTIPAWSILAKRVEALRLLDTSEISPSDYEGFFAVKQAFPQSLRWAMMSGIPLAASFVPKLIGFAG